MENNLSFDRHIRNKGQIVHVQLRTLKQIRKHNQLKFCLFVLRFYGPVNPMGSCRARSVYLTTRLLGRLSPLSG